MRTAVLNQLNAVISVTLTFAEVGAGPSVQEQLGQVVVGHGDGAHQRGPVKAEPGLHGHACPHGAD